MAFSRRGMEKRHPVLERLMRGQSIVLDGNIAEELVRRGYRPNHVLHDAAAAREAPELLTAIHRAYAEAGADVLTAFTARTTVRSLARGGLGMRAAALTNQAVDLALEVAQNAGRPIAVAGLLGSLEDPSRPDRTPSPRTLADEHTEQARRLEATGCDLILVEPMPTLRESLAATAAARSVRSTVWTILPLRDREHVSEGVSLEEAAAYTVSVGAQALLLEGSSTTELVSAVSKLSALALGVPIGVRQIRSSEEGTASADRFASDLSQVLQRGARLLGGARGTTPDDVRALAARVRARAAA
jgi:S-methylmethionine-dependent homocysteine/selenocysteine methylase